MTFRIGQKVVCISKSTSLGRTGETDAIVGQVYTIRDIASSDYWGEGIHLEEIRNPKVTCCVGCLERFMLSSRFRPIVERKTDISIFKKMLVPKTEEVEI